MVIVVLLGIVAFMFFLGMFLWSVMEDNINKLWLVPAAASIVLGVVGFLLTR